MASNSVYKKNPAYRSGFNHCTCFAVVKLRGNNEFGWTFGGRGSEENIHLPDSDPRGLRMPILGNRKSSCKFETFRNETRACNALNN